MTGELYLGPGGLRRFTQSHRDVAAGTAQLTGEGPDATDVANSHGTIASTVSGALDGALGVRQGTLDTTSTASNGFVDRLLVAAKSYGVQDERAAKDIRSTAEGFDSQPGAAGGASGATGAANSECGDGATSGSSAGSADPTSQIGQQVGQQVGQAAQAVGQGVAGLFQGLTQVPMQVMQGVQGIVQAVTGAAGGAGTAGADTAETRTGTGDAAQDERRDDKPASERSSEEAARKDNPSDRAAASAGPGDAITGPAPDAPNRGPVQPAQTRPQ